MNILVVDDITITRALLRQMLSAGKHNVMEASNVKDALAILKDSEIHLVITDLALPDGDGIAVLEGAANVIGNPPSVILFTASTDERTISFAKKAGFAKVLNKPLSAERIDEMLAVCAANQELVTKGKGSGV